MKKHLSRSSLLLLPLILTGVPTLADTVNYEYDALGRLERVKHVGISDVVYEVDPAGNRTRIATILAPNAPPSINVPSVSATGAYTITWGTGSGDVTSYRLYEATNSDFSGQVQVYSGAAPSHSISGQGDGTYYYRVQACNTVGCGESRSGSNPVSVTLVGTPPSLNVPSSSTTGSYTISWGTSSGTVTAYRLYEATNSSFSNESLVYDGASTSKPLSGKANGTYYYRVRACNAAGCSGYRTAGNSITVTLPPGVPASISVPTSNTTGSYTISWGTASGVVTSYELYEATNSSFTGQVLVYSGSASSKALSGRGNGTYHYRVRACNGPACSGYRTASSGVTVTLPPGVPSSISVPASNHTGNYTISWGASSGTVTAYKLYEATSSSFSGQVQVYSGTGRSRAISGKGQGTYYYRVRACNNNACSGYRAGSNAVTVTLPPEPPANVFAPSQVYGGNYSVSWSSSTGATRYELWESGTFGSYDRIYNGAGTGKSFVGKPSGYYTYKVKACNAAGCSAFSTTRTCMVCNPQCEIGGT